MKTVMVYHFIQKKSLGLALGGGGARAFVHIGILEALAKANIRINAISGTSMGAIIAAVYALGIPLRDLLSNAIKYGPKRYISYSTFNLFHESLIKPDDFEKMLRNLFGDKQFSDCLIPFRCTAVDLISGRLITLHKGKIWKAVRASCSLPFFLPPFYHQGHLLVDGGILDNVPVLSLRELNTDVVMGVKVNTFTSRKELSEAIAARYGRRPKKIDTSKSFLVQTKDRFRFLTNTVLRTLEISTEITTSLQIEKARPDLLLEPDVPIGLIETKKAKEVIAMGKMLMEKRLPALRKLLR